MKKLGLFLLLLLIWFAGCARFENRVTFLPDGTRIHETIETGAIFLSRKANFKVTDEWLDSNNVLHEFSTERNVDENADGQIEVMRMMFEAGKAASGKGL